MKKEEKYFHKKLTKLESNSRINHLFGTPTNKIDKQMIYLIVSFISMNVADQRNENAIDLHQVP